MKATFLDTYLRGLDSLRVEIESYDSEDDIWKVPEGILNSGGNLCLHMVGNLNHFIGAILGKTGYVRQRDLEFSDKGLSRDELLKRIAEVRDIVETTLKGLSDDSFAEDYPELLFERQMDNAAVLVHMAGHLSYHLGQLNYHRRLTGN